jgi:hypothetical protein
MLRPLISAVLTLCCGAALAPAAPVLALLAPAPPQEDDGAAAESELARVQRDQSRIGLRISSLRDCCARR